MLFLDDEEFIARPLSQSISELTPIALFLGQGNQGLEIAVFSASKKPNRATLHKAFKERKAGRASPVLIVVLSSDEVTLCGTGGEAPPVFQCSDLKQAERLCKSALQLPDRNRAIQFLANAMPSLETQLPGINNEGLLTNHELTEGTKKRDDWEPAVEMAKKTFGKTNKELINALGFSCQRLDNLTEVLSAGEEKTALAVLLKEDEFPEVGSERFNNISPVSYALTKADKERLPWVIMVQGDRVRLYNTKNIGVGRRGRTETFVECQLSLMSSKDAGLVWLLFSSDALKEGGTIKSILEESKRFAANIADRLRERIYEVVVPQLAMGIAKAQNLAAPSKDDIALTYEMALTVLFRLLFVAYAEDRDLLPFKGNEAYRRRSLKQKAVELARAASNLTPISSGDHHWVETTQLWLAVSRGNKEWGVPAYDGTIFSRDESISKAGAALANLSLSNASFEVALRGLLLTDAEDTPYAPVDFRALSVREFGTIYEGLLESELSLAEQNLTIDKQGTYLPAGEGDTVVINRGEIYLHDRSGARKSSGSYYTPDFAVEHLLDGALEPALEEHLDRMTLMSDADRTEHFFDFRVADIAMGSGHFLVAVIDRIERRFSLWLEDNPTPGITRELQYLKEAAKKELGELVDTVVIEDGQLLRRMIARRCIYGVDLNSLTVQLARLSIWIHTFVPGLPLSLLDHNLVQGNALVGIASLDEVRKKFDQGSGTLFEVDADNLLGQAAQPLRKLAQLSDASVKDIEVGRMLIEEARLKTLETKALLDLITAQPVSDDPRLKSYQFEDWMNLKADVQKSPALRAARNILKPLSVLHFPIAFPEVFLGRSQGFNVILGNPPWEKIKVEEHNFIATRFPGVRSLSRKEYTEFKATLFEERPDLKVELEHEIETMNNFRKLINNSGNFGKGKGDPDLYKCFCWRFLAVSNKSFGKIGVVMPRNVTASEGSSEFRKHTTSVSSHMNITVLKNHKGWVFPAVTAQYTIALICCELSQKKESKFTFSLNGPFKNIVSLEQAAETESPIFSITDLERWSENFSFPMLPESDSINVFTLLNSQPRLDRNRSSFVVRPMRNETETTDREFLEVNKHENDEFWPVYTGKSFNIWEPDTGKYYCWGDPKKIIPWLQEKRMRAHLRTSSSGYFEQPRGVIQNIDSLPCLGTRIIFRDVARASDFRTIIPCLAPPKIFTTENDPFLLLTKGSQLDEAFLLGIMSSFPFDWYAKRWVEAHVRFHVFKNLTVPEREESSLLAKRIIEISGRLACPDERFADWAAAVGVEYGPLDPDDKQDKIYELDAVVAHLYGISETQLAHIFMTFHDGWDCGPHLNEVQRHYSSWARKL